MTTEKTFLSSIRKLVTTSTSGGQHHAALRHFYGEDEDKRDQFRGEQAYTPKTLRYVLPMLQNRANVILYVYAEDSGDLTLKETLQALCLLSKALGRPAVLVLADVDPAQSVHAFLIFAQQCLVVDVSSNAALTSAQKAILETLQQEKVVEKVHYAQPLVSSVIASKHSGVILVEWLSSLLRQSLSNLLEGFAQIEQTPSDVPCGLEQINAKSFQFFKALNESSFSRLRRRHESLLIDVPEKAVSSNQATSEAMFVEQCYLSLPQRLLRRVHKTFSKIEQPFVVKSKALRNLLWDERKEPFIEELKALSQRLSGNDWSSALSASTVQHVKFLAEGGFGKVYEGLWSNTEVAVKVLKADAGQAAQEEFKNEVALMMQLKHPRIVQCYGLCLNPLQAVFELMRRGSLESQLRENETPKKPFLDWSIRKPMLLDMAEAIHYLHTHHIVHGDLRSANFLMDNEQRVKLGDFGLAKQRAGVMTIAFADIRHMGKPGWLAPELLSKEGARTAASDVYSFGMVVWELVTGYAPFCSEKGTLDDKATLDRIKSGEVLTHHVLPSDTPPWVVAMFNACLVSNPAERPTMSEIVEVLCLAIAPERYAKLYSLQTRVASPWLEQTLSLVPNALKKTIENNASNEKVVSDSEEESSGKSDSEEAISPDEEEVPTTTASAVSIHDTTHTPKRLIGKAKTFFQDHQDEVFGGAVAVIGVINEVVPDEVKAVFVILNVLLKKVQEAKSNQEQCDYLGKRAQSVVPYLQKINETKLKNDRSLRQALEEFKLCLEGCVEQVDKFGEKHWFRRILQSGVDSEKFNELNTRLGNAIGALNLGVTLQAVSNQASAEQARQKDQTALSQQVKEILECQKQAINARSDTDLDQQEQAKTLSLNLQASLVQLSEKLELNTNAQQKFLEENLKKLMDQQFTRAEYEQLLAHQAQSSYVSAKKGLSSQLLISLNDIAIQQVIKKGSFGTIYQGQWCYHPVAVKLIESSKATDYAEFVREVEIMSRLRHPNITQLYGACLDPKPCLVMELMAGGSLENKIEKSGALTEAEACQIAQGVASGLFYLHQRDIYHRDVKTANILLNAQGQAKLSDFGLSKVHDVEVKTAGEIAFDKEWLAPEILKAERAAGLKGGLYKKSVASTASDVYSFGLVLWSMLTGKKPLSDVEDIGEKFNRIIEGRMDLSVNSTIPKAVQELICRCCAPNFCDRPVMEEVIETLVTWQKQLNPDLSPRTLCTQGREHEKNKRAQEAFTCYQKAADKDFADGLYKLGQAFFMGAGCAQNNMKAFQYTQRAAEKGHVSATYNLARAYEKGLGCPVDKPKAVSWYQKAAQGDDPAVKKQAQEKLATLTKS